ncbi:MAG: type 4a pilus biogenesis protein PilO [Bdellovibrionaceae bacterium]|nr:type 4a pilus biogenesis protein PilO [Pseudobdellovibrionaceae bacterium]
MNQLFEKLSGLSNSKALVLGMVLGALYYFMLYDDGSAQLAQIQTLNQQLSEAETKRKDTEATLQEESRMKDAIVKLSEQYAFISKKLPSELKSSEMIRSIDVVAKTSGVSVKLKKPGSIEKKAVVEELPIEVTLEGSYGQITQFIYYISNLERLTRVINFSLMSQSPDGGIEKGLRFDGHVVSYKLAPEAEKGLDEKDKGTTP